MVYERPGRGHSSPGYSYSGRNYYREKTPEEKEQERIKEQKRQEQQQLEQTALQSTLKMPDSASNLVVEKVANSRQVWQELLQIVSGKYGSKIASKVADNVSQGVLPIGRLVEAEVSREVAVEIYQNWDSLWSESTSSVVADHQAQINQVFQAGIPTAIVGTYGTTLGTKVIWRSFGAVIAQRFGAVAAQALGLSAADGLLPVGEAIAFGLLAATAWQIARNWDELWAEAEQILIGQEPEPQIYTTPTGEQVETPLHTGHAPEKVETGTPGFDTESAPRTPNHTGHETKEPVAEDFIMESRRNVDSHDKEGGHTTDRHIGKSEDWLRERLRSEGKRKVSSFDDMPAANLTQARFTKQYKKEIDAWLESNETKPLARNIIMDREIGIIVPKNGKSKRTKKAKVVLAKDKTSLGYHVVTSYPIP